MWKYEVSKEYDLYKLEDFKKFSYDVVFSKNNQKKYKNIIIWYIFIEVLYITLFLTQWSIFFIRLFFQSSEFDLVVLVFNIIASTMNVIFLVDFFHMAKDYLAHYAIIPHLLHEVCQGLKYIMSVTIIYLFLEMNLIHYMNLL